MKLSLPSDPLLSSFVTLCILILIYFPYISLRFFLSQVLIITVILLFFLLRFGSVRRVAGEGERNRGKTTSNSDEQKDWDYDKSIGFKSEEVSETEVDFAPNLRIEDWFVEWNVRAPLEVIYEVYEGEETEKGPDLDLDTNEETQIFGIDNYKFLSLYDSDTSSISSSSDGFSAIGEWYSPENVCFRWDEEEERDGLIEIALDGKRKRDGFGFHVEEDNLIEIDISPGRMAEFSVRNGGFPVSIQFN